MKDNQQFNPSLQDIQEQLNELMFAEPAPKDFNLQQRYAAIRTALVKAQLRVVSMLNHSSDLSEARHLQLQGQAAQFAGFIAALDSFKVTVDDELLSIERKADIAQRRQYLERSYVARPAKRTAAQETPGVFSSLSRAERIRLMHS